MSVKIIPLVDLRRHPPGTRSDVENRAPAAHAAPIRATGELRDQHARPLRDLRISVTDRCNFRCVYCMPKQVFDKDYAYLPHSALLTFEEIVRIARSFVAHGVEKIRLTGGEPLLRKNIESLIEQLATLRTTSGAAVDIALTTNGALLAKKARQLKEAGLHRVTVSLDALSDANFKRMNDVDFPVSEVLDGIAAAHAAGLGPIKVNMVVKAGLNEAEIVPMARHFKGSPHILRFIEYMDVGNSNGWKMDEVISSAEVRRRIHADMPLVQVPANYVGETAERWRYYDGTGEVGFISSVTQSFCHACTRARLSTEGKVYTCLFASHGHDLREPIRNGADAQHLDTLIGQLWQQRDDRYSALRGSMGEATPQRVEMSYIGG